MLDDRLRLWSNIDPALGSIPVLAAVVKVIDRQANILRCKGLDTFHPTSEGEVSHSSKTKYIESMLV